VLGVLQQKAIFLWSYLIGITIRKLRLTLKQFYFNDKYYSRRVDVRCKTLAEEKRYKKKEPHIDGTPKHTPTKTHKLPLKE